MIQRIQTLYLGIVAVITGGLISVVDLWSSQIGEVYALDLIHNESLISKCIPVLFLMSSLLALVVIFLYKNRQLQFVLGRLIILIHLLLLVLLTYLLLTLSGEAAVSEKGIGMLIPVVAILLIFLANKAIKKDEDLVKSVDRLR